MQDPPSTEYATRPPAPAGSPPPPLSSRVAWRLLGSGPGRFVAICVCRFMRRQLESKRGAPTLLSRNGVVRLWRVERFQHVSWSPDQPWVLDDRIQVDPSDPVLEFHIAADRFLVELLRTAHWRTVIWHEFHSLVPLLESRDEIALVGSTILRRQVSEFGASLRELPPGLYRSFDTFYRKLILLAFHPGGARRQEFCRRYRL
jgi:hypothetical protein